MRGEREGPGDGPHIAPVPHHEGGSVGRLALDRDLWNSRRMPTTFPVGVPQIDCRPGHAQSGPWRNGRAPQHDEGAEGGHDD